MVDALAGLVECQLLSALFVFVGFLDLQYFEPELLDFRAHVVELDRGVEFAQVLLGDDKKLTVGFSLVSSNHFVLVGLTLVRMALALVSTELLGLLELLAADLARELKLRGDTLTFASLGLLTDRTL